MRYFLTEAGGAFRAFAFDAVKTLQLLFLLAQFENDGLHGSGHKCWFIFDPGNGVFIDVWAMAAMLEDAAQNINRKCQGANQEKRGDYKKDPRIRKSVLLRRNGES